jgi:hypothetical protein
MSGRLILARMLGTPAGIPEDFGVELTPSTLARHQAAQRARRDGYHRLHAAETRIVQGVVAEAGDSTTAQPFSHLRTD